MIKINLPFPLLRKEGDLLVKVERQLMSSKISFMDNYGFTRCGC
jgi:hypothetical protein